MAGADALCMGDCGSSGHSTAPAQQPNITIATARCLAAAILMDTLLRDGEAYGGEREVLERAGFGVAVGHVDEVGAWA